MDVKHDYAHLGDVDLHYVSAGLAPEPGRPPLVLIHGWPQTWYEWRHVMPALGERFTVIAPDMRGLGDSSRPLTGYDKKNVADDLRRLLEEHLGYERYHLVGHDWGGPVAFRLAAARPQATLSLAILDVTIPGIGPDISQGGKRWHHGFHMTPDLPEALTAGRERDYLMWFYREFSYRPDAVDAAAAAEYLRCYTQTGAMRAGFAYYRAIPQDIEDNRALLEQGPRLQFPVLAMGGAVRERRGRAEEPEASLREVADDVRGIVVPESGHFIPEDRPDAVIEALLEHVR